MKTPLDVFFIVALLGALASSCESCELEIPADARVPVSEDVQRVDVVVSDTRVVDAGATDVNVVDAADVAFTDATIADAARLDVAGNALDVEEFRGDVEPSRDVEPSEDVEPSRDVDPSGDVERAEDVRSDDAQPVDAGPLLPAACEDAGLCATLNWDANYGDLDLHVSRNAQPWCTDDACYFGNCISQGPFRVDWDDVPGFSPGDPDLIDDSFAQGPEVFTLEEPFIGDYVIGAFFQPNNNITPIDATLRVFSFGNLVATQTHTLAPNVFWQAGTMVAESNAVSFNVQKRVCDAGEWICNDPIDTCETR